ncbi:TPA: glycoside hydrolase family 19 protein [Vibrio parahaemolyticus]
MVAINTQRINRYNEVANAYPKSEDNQTSYPDFDTLEVYNPSTIYAQSPTLVKYTENGQTGVFKSKWWTQGNIPDFEDKSSPWELVVRTDEHGNYLKESESISEWKQANTYVAGDKVKHLIDGVEIWFKAKYWTQGNEPVLILGEGCSAEAWETPWEKVEAVNNGEDLVKPPKPEDDLTKPPVCSQDCDNPQLPEDPTIPPVIPTPDPEPETPEIEPTPPVKPDLGNDGLPEDGYAFLRELSIEHWDWLFPMRSGRYNEQGGLRNNAPFAKKDGSTDTFTLSSFKNAVIEYNSWAKSNGYKQFLNEGTKSQQALEFVAFWAKSSRETSGSWDNAPEPWITQDEHGNHIWKGGLYWIEEVGYTTNEDGTSAAINYVDTASNYKPEPGRSYYGRGVIQLSWNYNYGAFSEWLYKNGMMKELITSPDTLLKRPDYVATKGELSILSGIWFWMTPQGAKPSSHDVIYGDVTNVSQFSQDQGLPQRNDGGQIPTAEGESNDEGVIAYRLGTITNIVNGGLECNKAAAWHPGPVQRIAYYNAYAQYMNDSGLGIEMPIVKDAVNAWSVKVTHSSPENLKTASCYAQKSYYGW